MNKSDLKECIVEALKNLNNKATVAEVCKYVWDNYKEDLEKSGKIL